MTFECAESTCCTETHIILETAAVPFPVLDDVNYTFITRVVLLLSLASGDWLAFFFSPTQAGMHDDGLNESAWADV